MQILSKLHSISRYGIPAVFLSSVTNKAIGFVSNMIVIRILSVEEYGLQASLYTVLSLIGLFAGGGMGSPLIIYGSEWRSPSERIRSGFIPCIVGYYSAFWLDSYRFY